MNKILSISFMLVVLTASSASALVLKCYDTVGSELLFEVTESKATVTATHVGLDQSSCTREPTVSLPIADFVQGQCQGVYLVKYVLNLTDRDGVYSAENSNQEVIVHDQFTCL